MRRGFSMMMALLVIVIMASLGAFIFSISGKVAKSTTLQYQHEQAALLAKSYTEYAVMAATANDRSINCLETIKGQYGDYTIEVQLHYIVASGVAGTCSSPRLLSSGVTTQNSPIHLIVDVYVRYKDADNFNDMPFTYHRRTLQKI